VSDTKVVIGVRRAGDCVVTLSDTETFNGVTEFGVKGHLEMEQQMGCFVVLFVGNSF
jgi:hypothetical protein